MKLLSQYFNLKGIYLLLIITVLNILMVWISKSLLINEIVFYNTFSEQLTFDRSMQLFARMNSIAWVSYLFSPLLLFLKFVAVSLMLLTGLVLFKHQENISFGPVFKVVIASEIAFSLGNLAKFLWFCFFAGNYDLNDLAFFFPLSLINFFNRTEVSKLWIYPLQTVNLFHILYVLLLAYGMNRICSFEKADSEKVVLISYLPGLVLWISLVMFLTIGSSV